MQTQTIEELIQEFPLHLQWELDFLLPLVRVIIQDEMAKMKENVSYHEWI